MHLDDRIALRTPAARTFAEYSRRQGLANRVVLAAAPLGHSEVASGFGRIKKEASAQRDPRASFSRMTAVGCFRPLDK